MYSRYSMLGPGLKFSKESLLNVVDGQGYDLVTGLNLKNWPVDLITKEHMVSTGKCILSSKYLIEANEDF